MIHASYTVAFQQLTYVLKMINDYWYKWWFWFNELNFILSPVRSKAHIYQVFDRGMTQPIRPEVQRYPY